ncbi:acyltransferase family protein [Gemelliphila palaticanis]|uniref:Acyltransferase n=1 Tax=Gemelliphila palaticanis TaxID=81950 RepID=A0ABX2T3Z1_9BACL|nr:acyltransferase family protein [Gemella palaticanis]MBF0716020.1 acyltransferase [Gemella palaticanis]NYS47950.1 acyltransferase [Gemella palaticanis]
MNKHKYLPSIDSLRAIAVISVIIYHCNPNYLSGGFLGVDLFFVLSGYLISSLIIKEYRETNSLNLYNFYIRRARRLLPAVYFMITVTLVIMVVFNKPLLDKSYLDATFGYLYSSNWWYIVHKLDYFDTFGSPSPFKHLWSLAIEEQFYMFFPIIFIIINKYNNKKFTISKIFKNIILFLILASLITHVILFDINNINRVYYGTDTRMFELLVGVLGSLIYPLDKLSLRINNIGGKIFTIISMLLIIIFVFSMIFVTEYSKFLYYGGFLLYSIMFLIIIITSGQQGTLISKILSFKPLVFIGKLSYSLYLWHFPILVLTTPSSEIGNPNFIYNLMRVVLIFVVAYLSYTFVETPIRKQGFVNFIKLLFAKITNFSIRRKATVFITSSLFIMLFLMGLFGKSLPYTSTLFAEEYNGEKVTEINTGTENNKEDSNNDTSKKEEKVEKTVEDDTIYNNVLIIGDSLAVDIAPEFLTRYPGTIIDGKVSRQLYDSVNVVKQYEQYNSKSTAVIFLLGTNGTFEDKDLENLIEPVRNADIYFVNTRVPRVWEKVVNSTLDFNKDKLNYKVIDWYAIAKQHKEYFANDQVHLKDSGVVSLVNLMEKSLNKKIETKEMKDIAAKKLVEQNNINNNTNVINGNKNNNTSATQKPQGNS